MARRSRASLRNSWPAEASSGALPRGEPSGGGEKLRGAADDGRVEDKGEHRSFAEFAAGLQLSAHEARQAQGGGQAKTRPLARRVAGAEGERELRARHARAGVRHDESEAHAALVRRSARTPP